MTADEYEQESQEINARARAENRGLHEWERDDIRLNWHASTICRAFEKIFPEEVPNTAELRLGFRAGVKALVHSLKGAMVRVKEEDDEEQEAEPATTDEANTRDENSSN